MAQFAYPSGDVTATNWTGSYTAIDEGATPSDSDYVYSQDNPSSTDYFEVTLDSLTDPVSSTGHVLRWRHVLIDGGAVASDAGTGCDLDVYLRQGTTTTIASKLTIVLDAVLSWTADSITLSAGEADSITDYTALRFRAGAAGGGGGPTNRRGAGISWVELEVPTATNDRIAQISAFEFETPDAPPRTYSTDFYEVTVKRQNTQVIAATSATQLTDTTITPASGDYLAIANVEFDVDGGSTSVNHIFSIYAGGTEVPESRQWLRNEGSYEVEPFTITTFAKVTVNGSQAVDVRAWNSATPIGTGMTIYSRSLILIPLSGLSYEYFGIYHEQSPNNTNTTMSGGVFSLNEGFSWTDRTATETNTWSLHASGGGAPEITGKPPALWDSTLGLLTEGTLGSLNEHEWAWGDQNSLGYNTVYFRDASGDPDTSGVDLHVVVKPGTTGDYFAMAAVPLVGPGTTGTPPEEPAISIYNNGSEVAGTVRREQNESSFAGTTQHHFTSGVVNVTSGNPLDFRYGSKSSSGGAQKRRSVFFVWGPLTSGTHYWQEIDSTVDSTASGTYVDIDDNAGTDWSQTPGLGDYVAIFSFQAYPTVAATEEPTYAWFVNGSEHFGDFYSRAHSVDQSDGDGGHYRSGGIVGRVSPTAGQDVAVAWKIPGTALTHNMADRSMVLLKIPSASTDRSAEISAFEFEVPNAPRKAQISAYEFEVPNAPRRAQISAYELEVPTAPRKAQISAYEFEVPNAPRRAQISAYEFEVETPKRAQISAFEFEVPNAPRRAQISAYELEVPTAPRRAQISAYEFELPNAPRKAQISAFEFETPNADRKAQISAFEFETPNADRKAQISAYEFEVPTAPRKAQISAYEFELPNAPRRAQISAFEFETPNADRKAQISAYELELPDPPTRWAMISAFEFEVPNAPRRAQISAYEFEVPNAPRRANISAFELEVPNAPRRANVSAFELEVPTAPRKANVSAFELEMGDAARTAMISAFELEVPTASRVAQISAYEFETGNPPRRAMVSAFELQLPSVGAPEGGMLWDDLGIGIWIR